MNSETMYCELCGRPIRGKAYKVKLEGAIITVCDKCYQKLMAKSEGIEVVTEERKEKKRYTAKTTRPVKKHRRPKRVEYEVVDDYNVRIKRAREKMGWTLGILAQRVMEKETVLRRIEQGRLRPSIDLASRLERVLGITLLEPVVEEEYEGIGEKGFDSELTLGDLANIKMKGKKET
jgi:putative transcription factor